MNAWSEKQEFEKIDANLKILNTRTFVLYSKYGAELTLFLSIIRTK